jgi:NAD(P)-dependent dehydrogenase (short-subunit alcohol dehydrogenase family)
VGDLVFITGASSGIGLALTRSVPFEASVVDISRSGSPDPSVGHVAADLADPGTWEKVGSEMTRLIETNDPDRAVFIHAAGTLHPIGFAGEVDSSAYASNVILNSAAGQVLGHHFLKAVHDREGTFDLVMISSGAATNVYPGWSSYGAGKAALDHWVRAVGAEQAERGGVRVAAIAPGVVATDMQEEIRSTPKRDFPNVDRFHSLHEDGVLSEPEDAADRIWKVIERGVDQGSVVDVRDL